MKLGDLYEISWIDHSGFSYNTWRTVEEGRKLSPVYVKTVGYVIKETKEYILLVNTIAGEKDEYADLVKGEHCLLKTCIIKAKKLK